MKLYCIGCGELMTEDYKGEDLCLTHHCGAIIFRLENGRLLIPASLYRARALRKEPPHIDYYVGKSKYMDEYKRTFIDLLKGLSAIWRKDCNVCRKLKKEEKLNVRIRK